MILLLCQVAVSRAQPQFVPAGADTLPYCYLRAGNAAIYQNEEPSFAEALYQYRQALQYSLEQNEDQVAIARSYYRIGNIYDMIKDTKQAKAYYQKSLRHAKAASDSLEQAVALFALAIIEEKVNPGKQLAPLFLRALETHPASRSLYLQIKYELHYYGIAAPEMKTTQALNVDSLFQSIYQRIAHSKELSEEDVSNLQKLFASKYAEALFKTHPKEEALHILDSVLETMPDRAIGHTSAMLRAKRHLYLTSGDYKKAYEVTDKLLELNINFGADRQMEKILELEMANRDLIRKNQLRTARSDLRLSRLTILGICLLLAGVSALSFKLHKQKKALNKQTLLISKQNKEKEVILKELNHRVKNNLQFLNSMLHMQIIRSQNPQAKEALQASLSRVEAMMDAHQFFYEGEDKDSQQNSQEYLGRLFKRLCDTVGLNRSRLRLELEPIAMQEKEILNLGMIANELFMNSLKHAQVLEEELIIKVKFYSAGNKVNFEYSDNGDGYMQNPADGMGLKMIRMLSDGMQAEQVHQGPHFKLSFDKP